MTIKKRTGTPADSEAGSEAGSWQGVDDRTLTLSRVLVNLEEHFDQNEATSGTDPAPDPAAPKQITDVLAPQISGGPNCASTSTCSTPSLRFPPYLYTASTHPHTSPPLCLSPKSSLKSSLFVLGALTL